MPMHHLILLFLPPAIQQAVEVLHHSQLPGLTALRRRAQGLWDTHDHRLLLTPLKALACPWCTSVWVALPLAALAAAVVADGPGQFVLWWPLLVLGGSRVANWLNDWLHPTCRTPRDGLLSRASDEAVEAEYHRRFSGQPETGGAEAPRV